MLHYILIYYNIIFSVPTKRVLVFYNVANVTILVASTHYPNFKTHYRNFNLITDHQSQSKSHPVLPAEPFKSLTICMLTATTDCELLI